MGDQRRLTSSPQRERLWRKVITGQRQSGMSVVAWCRQQGVSAPSFYVWRQRLAKRVAERKLRGPQLLPVEIVPSAAGESDAPLEIELPSQVRVRVRPGCDVELLRQVLTMLQQDRREPEGC